jgi:hypothetical protein
MPRRWALSIVILFLAAAGAAQDGLTIPMKAEPLQMAEEAREIYLAACATVQQEFGRTHPLSPKVTLVLGAEKDGVLTQKGEVQLRKWDRYLFAQGVVILAFGELMPTEEKLTMAKRAVSWAGATIGVQQMQK